MIKKVIVVCLLILLIGGGAYIYLTSKNASSSSSVLSERSKAFISDKQKDSSSDWRYARLEEGEDKAGAFVGKRVEVDSCFSFVMLFRVTNPRQESECNWYFGIEKPKGMVTAYTLAMENIDTVDDVDGVSMRQINTDKYAEEKMTINGITYLVFVTRPPHNYEANAFAYVSGKALIFNLITPGQEKYDKEFEAMLRSIEIK